MTSTNRIVRTVAAIALTAGMAGLGAGSAQAQPTAHTPAHPTAATNDGSGHGARLSWHLLKTPNDTARLRGLAPVSAKVAWASGTEGTILRTVDGGRTVTSVGPAGTQALQFRSLYASSARHAVAVSIGDTPDAMRAYVTEDGGKTWTKSLQNTLPTAFYDCMTFTGKRTGYILSDPVDGKFMVLRTRDGGHSWQRLPGDKMPAAKTGEAGFAASGTCIQSNDRGDLFFGTGGVNPARVFTSRDGGRSWKAADAPLAGSAASGIFSLSFGHGRSGSRNGVMVGGDYTKLTTVNRNAAWTNDSGRTWHPATGIGGYRSGSSFLAGSRGTVLAVGPAGSDVSTDAGRNWRTFDTGSFDAVECVPNACYASGEAGRLARLTWTR